MPLPQRSIFSFIFFIWIVSNFPYHFPHCYRPAYCSSCTFLSVSLYQVFLSVFLLVTDSVICRKISTVHKPTYLLDFSLDLQRAFLYERIYFQNEIWKFPLHDELIVCFKDSEINTADTENLLHWTNLKPFLIICTEFYSNIYIQQDATLHTLFYLETALHVSGGTIIHNQERKQLYLQHLVFVTP